MPASLVMSLLAVSITSSFSVTAVAQSQVALEEVVVTAQRREQSLQDIPVAVTALSADALADRGVADITEIQRIAPNTTLQVSRGTNSTLTAYIRGVGQADPLWGFEPGVGLYVDDVYLARPQAGVLDVYDVERVEVLRGPQGTLYGKNTIGGALKYVTKRLSGEQELSVTTSVGSYRQLDVSVAGQMPLSDTVAVGGAIARFTRDGFGEFILNDDENYNKDIVSGRFSIEFTPNDALWIRIAADSTEDDSNAKGGHRLTQSLRVPDEGIPSSVYDSNADMSTFNSVESSGVSLTAEWDVTDSVTLKSITAYREGETFTNIDFDNTSLPSVHVPAIYEDDQTTQEFQLNYTSDRLAIVSGVYLYEGTASGAFDVLLGAFDSTDVFGDGSNVIGNFNAVTSGTVDTTSYALYAHTTYDVSEALALTLGARYTVDEKDASVFRSSLFVEGLSSRLGGRDLSTLSVSTDYSNDEQWSEFSPRVSVDYRFNEMLMAYGAFSRGFKSGGFDMRGNATLNPETVNGYDPETVDSIELGMKTELWDSRLRINAALYSMDYDDVQVTVQNSADGGTTFASAVVNAGKAEVDGAELEISAQLTEGLSLTGSVGYTNAEFTEVITDTESGPVNVADEWEFAFTPEWTSFLAVNYFHTVANIGSINWSVSTSYRDETRIFPNNASLVDEKGYSLWDASIVWTSTDENWTVGLHGKNLTDEEYRVGGYNFLGLGAEDSIIGYYGNPRTYSLTANYRF
ncbi:TonB-dependent receptor [Marinibactrum halimedae]|nr:TonB-dependent receptor [Marinibactrum halimedae]MCD9458569.1 TonB-dependent receptor [Marinibactrum halimedae]